MEIFARVEVIFIYTCKESDTKLNRCGCKKKNIYILSMKKYDTKFNWTPCVYEKKKKGKGNF